MGAVSEQAKQNLRAAHRARYWRKREDILEQNRLYRQANGEAIRARANAKYAANREAIREKARPINRESNRRRMGMPAPTRSCPEFCECCGGRPNGKGTLHLDHDHKTGKFRGWLCYLCNTGLGKLGDDREGLMKAMVYLEKNG